MRLIHLKSLELHEFTGSDHPPYAILSHTWEDGEVSFSQYADPRYESLAGHKKIKNFCKKALECSKAEYGWVDTCCIDKSSSAELTEAINSMYKWYESATQCIVFLADMPSPIKYPESGDEEEWLEARFEEFGACRWFQRGWTLQELLAPYVVSFFDCEWGYICTKHTMQDLLSRVSGIEPEHLLDPTGASVAQRMSWAATRQTTRPEDMAYSLMGLFNVNMPLLYGEGSRAFARLQEAIIQSNDDESIFAWTDDRLLLSGLLAKSPADFADSEHIVPFRHHLAHRPPFVMTNQGLQIELLCPVVDNGSWFDAPLRCRDTRFPGMITLQFQILGGGTIARGDPSRRKQLDLLTFTDGIERSAFRRMTYQVKEGIAVRFNPQPLMDLKWRPTTLISHAILDQAANVSKVQVSGTLERGHVSAIECSADGRAGFYIHNDRHKWKKPSSLEWLYKTIPRVFISWTMETPIQDLQVYVRLYKTGSSTSCPDISSSECSKWFTDGSRPGEVDTFCLPCGGAGAWNMTSEKIDDPEDFLYISYIKCPGRRQVGLVKLHISTGSWGLTTTNHHNSSTNKILSRMYGFETPVAMVRKPDQGKVSQQLKRIEYQGLLSRLQKYRNEL